MAKRFSVAGMTLSWAAETTAGTRPTTGYTQIHEIKEMPALNVQPNSIDATPLEEEEYILYVEGLKDLGGALPYRANLSDQLIEEWEAVLEAHDTAVEAGKDIWFCISHPKLAKATYYVGDPADLGLDAATVGSVLETTLYITPNSAPIRAAKPTL